VVVAVVLNSGRTFNAMLTTVIMRFKNISDIHIMCLNMTSSYKTFT
jgi:hypothetical protein